MILTEMDQLHQSYLRKVCRLRKQIELSHIGGEIRQNDNSVFTLGKNQKNVNPMILFADHKQLQEHRRKMSMLEVQNDEEGEEVV